MKMIEILRKRIDDNQERIKKYNLWCYMSKSRPEKYMVKWIKQRPVLFEIEEMFLFGKNHIAIDRLEKWK